METPASRHDPTMVPIRACNSNLARQCNALSNSSSSPEFRRSVFEIQFGHGLLEPMRAAQPGESSRIVHPHVRGEESYSFSCDVRQTIETDFTKLWQSRQMRNAR